MPERLDNFEFLVLSFELVGPSTVRLCSPQAPLRTSVGDAYYINIKKEFTFPVRSLRLKKYVFCKSFHVFHWANVDLSADFWYNIECK